MIDIELWTVIKDIAGPVSTVCASLVAAVITVIFARRQASIAERQAETADSKLKFDLFDRRFENYKAVKKILEMSFDADIHTPEQTSEFYALVDKAMEGQFLFSKKTFGKIFSAVNIAVEFKRTLNAKNNIDGQPWKKNQKIELLMRFKEINHKDYLNLNSFYEGELSLSARLDDVKRTNPMILIYIGCLSCFILIIASDFIYRIFAH